VFFKLVLIYYKN